MGYVLTVHHIDTCLSCYLKDHHTRDGECLIGVPVDRSSRYHHVKAALIADASLLWELFPENMSDETIRAAIVDEFSTAHPLKSFDSSLEKDDSDGDGCESVKAWFLFSWEETKEFLPEDEDDTTAVAFRVFPEGDVIALFPNDNEGNGLIGSFQHIGQHSGASAKLLTELRRATNAESADLRRELESAPYNYSFTFEPDPAPSDAPRSAAAIEAALPDALVSAYRYHRQNAQSSLARPGTMGAARCIENARADVARDLKRYASSDSRNVFAPYPAEVTFRAASPTRQRWVERPADMGLRFVGWADELNRSIDHTGWHTDENGDNGANMRGCVYQLPARNGRAQYVPAYGDPNNTPADCGGMAYVDFTNVHRADKMDYRDDGTVRDCAHSADSLAERSAEQEREYQRASNAAVDFGETVETYRGAFDRFRPLMRQARADHDRETVRHILGSLRTVRDVTRDKLATISGNFSRAAGFLDNLGDCEKRVLSRL